MAATRRKKSCKGGGPFVSGMLLGIGLSTVVWFLYLAPDSGSSSAGDAGNQGDLPPKPKFDFYTVLPEVEVVVPETEVIPPDTAEAQQETTTDKTAYMLQIGSFRKLSQADQQKAKLALLGIEAEIQKVSINNNDTWHRVRSGPYYGNEELNVVRNQLKKNGVNAIVIKLQKQG